VIEHDLPPEARDELGDLQAVFGRLRQYDTAEPDRARLLSTLVPLLVKPAENLTTTLPRRGMREWLRLAWAQLMLLEAPFWWSSLLIIVIGVVLGVRFSGAEGTLALLLLSPLVAAAGVAYLFRPATRTLWEFEQLSHVQPLEFFYARLSLILLLNGLIALFLLIFVWTDDLQIVLWRLLLIWLGPMISVIGIALYCSVRWNNFVGVIAPVLMWGALVVVGWRDTVLATAINLLDASTILTHFNLSGTIPLLAAVALTFGLFFIYEAGRMVTRWR
jgi:hypothetical protein